MSDKREIKKYDDRIEYWENGKLHRTDGPAIEYANGKKEWYVNSLLHRINGPAVEDVDGSKLWFVHGRYINREN